MSDEVERFLAAYDDAVKAVALAARAAIFRWVPDAEEKVLPAWKTIAYASGKKFCAVSPHQEWVNLQFHQGAALPDPSGLLEGTGKSMRHVKLGSKADVERRAVAALVKAAAELAGS
jgi:hypothetical protein